MENGVLAISDGTFTFSETKNKNQFYFFRNDGEVLTDISREPVDFFQAYIAQKMMTGEITEIVMVNFLTEISEDGKCLRLTVSDIGEEPNNSTANKKQPGFFARLLKKIFK